ncbi:MAG: hypothetical protein KA319_07130 [Ferruginibacter sp.]|nr:hypothetical protein [Ferruginibacter sp.]
MNNDKPTKQQLDEWSANPENWVLGIFYFNKLDKRIFPPKKIKSFGWTVNFANPISILALAAIVFAIIGFTNLLIYLAEK